MMKKRLPDRPPGPPAPRAEATPAQQSSSFAQLMQLQRQAGNHALAGQLAGGSGRVARAVPADPAKMTDDQVQAEIERNSTQREKVALGSRASLELFERSEALYEERDRRAQAADERDQIDGAKTTMARVVAETEQLQERFRGELGWVTETLDDVTGQLNTYLGYYNPAYATFASVLSTAKRDAEARAALENMVVGVVLSTGLGLAAGAIFESAKGLKKIAVAVGSSVAEALAGKAVQVSAPSVFSPPGNLDPRLRSDPAAEEILQAWRGLALFNSTTLTMGDYQHSVDRLAFALEHGPTIELVTKVNATLGHAEPAVLSGALDTLHASVLEFWEHAQHPLLKRNELELEQDMWIRWIESLPADETRYEALDEDVIENHLHRLGVLGADSRLGVDFGWITSGPDMDKATEASHREGDQLNQIGRYGAVADTLEPGKVGRVAVRDDVYARLGKKLPPGADPDGVQVMFPAVSWTESIQDGQIVRIVGSSLRGLEVRAATDAEGNPVFL